MEISDESPTVPLGSWEQVLDRADIDVAAGLKLPLGPVLARMQDSVDRLNAKQAARELTTAKP